MSCAGADGEGTAMARRRRGTKDELIFEGVVIPRRTRSAKLAAKGIRNEEDFGRFLTAVFSDTLKGKIVLPKLESRGGASSNVMSGAQQKLGRGLPVTIQAKKLKGTRSLKAKEPMEAAGMRPLRLV
jgi:hypothetical protein